MEEKKLVGFIHSIESMGTLDGPGLRTVVFFQGCPLKCKFCHNIDTNAPKQGQILTVDQLVDKVISNQPYWISQNDNSFHHGGVTISGGEPTLQPQYLKEFIKTLKSKGVHIAVDTCMQTTKQVIDDLFPYVDLWMISVKEFDEDKHKWLTSASNRQILENIKYIDEKITSENAKDKKIRIRYLVIPQLTDSLTFSTEMGTLVSSIKNLDCLELLAYGTHGKHKWYELFGEYYLEDYRDATNEDLKNIKEQLSQFNFEIKY